MFTWDTVCSVWNPHMNTAWTVMSFGQLNGFYFNWLRELLVWVSFGQKIVSLATDEDNTSHTFSWE